jgi:DNA repair exonuclease SbcCD nuclease subunit
MKLLLFADLHLDTPFQWAPGAVARTRRQGLRDTLSRITQLAAEVGADALLCGGDLYEHERFSPDTAAFVRSVFELVHPLPVYLAPGNHDWYAPESLYCQVDWSPNVHVFTTDRLQPVTLADGLTLWGAAHRAPANTDGFVEHFAVDRGGVHLALFHGSERHGLMQEGKGKIAHAPFDAEELERAGLHHAFLGHYHRPRDAARHTYPGNPEPLGFGEEGERGVVIATVAADGSVTRTRRHVGTTTLHDDGVDITGCRSVHDIRDRVTRLLDGRSGVARLTFSGDLEPDVDLHLPAVLDAAPWMDALVLRLGTIRAAYDIDALAAQPTVRGQFVRDVNAADLPDDVRRRVLITGLRALDGRDDLEAP